MVCFFHVRFGLIGFRPVESSIFLDQKWVSELKKKGKMKQGLGVAATGRKVSLASGSKGAKHGACFP